MIIKVSKRENPFAQIDKGVLQNSALSYKARGIASYLLSHDGDWEVRLSDLVANSPDGIKAIRSGMQELKRQGYARLVPLFDADKQLKGKAWEVSETPIYGGSTDIPILATSPKSERRETGTITNKDISIYSPVINFLNEQTGSRFRSSSKKTQSLINARVREGATVEDFQKVIAHMAAKWRNDAKMAQYLRPETLFGTKFEGYLNAATRAGQKAEAQKDVELNPEQEQRYQEYLAHITKSHPGLTACVAYLSRAQYKTFKERKYLNGLGYIGEAMERRALQLAHNQYEQNHPDAVRHPSVWDYHVARLQKVIQESTTI